MILKGTDVIIKYCEALYPIVTWKVLGKVTDTIYTLIDNHSHIYWYVDINDLKIVN